MNFEAELRAAFERKQPVQLKPEKPRGKWKLSEEQMHRHHRSMCDRTERYASYRQKLREQLAEILKSKQLVRVGDLWSISDKDLSYSGTSTLFNQEMKIRVQAGQYTYLGTGRYQLIKK